MTTYLVAMGGGPTAFTCAQQYVEAENYEEAVLKAQSLPYPTEMIQYIEEVGIDRFAGLRGGWLKN